MNENKKCLVALLFHLVTDCPANLHLIVDDVEAMSRILDSFISLRCVCVYACVCMRVCVSMCVCVCVCRATTDSIFYNETMIPLQYRLIHICIQRNPSFIPQVCVCNTVACVCCVVCVNMHCYLCVSMRCCVTI